MTPDEARMLIRDQVLGVEACEVERLGEGWDNLVYRVDRAWVFRFPRRELAAHLLRTESLVLPRVAHRLSLSVPVPVWFGEPCPEFPWPFVGYGYLAGRDASRVELPDARRGAQAPALGRFLAGLHAQPTGGLEGLPDDDLGRMDLELRLPRARELLARAIEVGLVPRAHGFGEVLEDLPRGARPTVLAHGDLWSKQMLVDEAGDLGAVLDWGDVHRGDPAVDLMVAHAFLPPWARPALRDAYGGVDDDTWKLARFRALCHTLSVALHALEVDDGELLRDGRASLARIAEDA